MRGFSAVPFTFAITLSFVHAAAAFASSSIIIGGEDVQATDPVAKRTVALRISGGLCTGSIYAEDLVVTAAHCLPQWPGFHETMEIAFSVKANDPQAEVRVVKDFRGHPDYIPETGVRNRNDVALLFFEGGLPQGYRPATLLPDYAPLLKGQKVWLAGYGVTHAEMGLGAGTLRKVQVTLRDVEYSETEVLTEQTFGHGACFGDSGGPAYVKKAGTYYLFGVTNWGPGYCDNYGVYANLNAYRDWLEETAADLRKGL